MKTGWSDNALMLDCPHADDYATKEVERLLPVYYQSGLRSVHCDFDRPRGFTMVELLYTGDTVLRGFSKRRNVPQDCHNDKTGISVAISNLMKRRIGAC